MGIILFDFPPISFSISLPAPLLWCLHTIWWCSSERAILLALGQRTTTEIDRGRVRGWKKEKEKEKEKKILQERRKGASSRVVDLFDFLLAVVLVVAEWSVKYLEKVGYPGDVREWRRGAWDDCQQSFVWWAPSKVSARSQPHPNAVNNSKQQPSVGVVVCTTTAIDWGSRLGASTTSSSSNHPPLSADETRLLLSSLTSGATHLHAITRRDFFSFLPFALLLERRIPPFAPKRRAKGCMIVKLCGVIKQSTLVEPSETSLHPSRTQVCLSFVGERTNDGHKKRACVFLWVLWNMSSEFRCPVFWIVTGYYLPKHWHVLRVLNGERSQVCKQGFTRNSFRLLVVVSTAKFSLDILSLEFFGSIAYNLTRPEKTKVETCRLWHDSLMPDIDKFMIDLMSAVLEVQ